MNTIKTTFWIFLFLTFYTYIGYGIILYVIIRIKRIIIQKQKQILQSETDLPEVTMLICAYNEQNIVKMKMENIAALDYSKDKLHIMWATDGSTDSTNEYLKAYPSIQITFHPERRGKTAAMNRAIPKIQTGIIIMTDANTMINPGAIKEIVRLFNDPSVGCVAGEKRVMARNNEHTAAKGEGLYWKYESTLKRWDYELYSAMGAAGELCAIRKELFDPIPEDTLLDDFILSMSMIVKGYRIAYTPYAYAFEYGSANIEEESKRKRRIAAGGLQSIWRLKNLMNPIKYPIVAFQFISHRVLRWSITPIALFSLIPLNTILVFSKAGTIYTIIWVLQIMFYAAAFGGYLSDTQGRRNRILYVPYYFMFMNINVFRGIRYLFTHKNTRIKKKVRRG